MGKNTMIERRKQTLRNQGEKTFMARNFPLYIFLMFIIYPFAAIFSGLTEGFYVFSNFETTFNSFAPAITATVIIVILIEGGSIILGKSVFEDIRHGAIGGTGSEIAVFIIKAIGFLICFAFSIILSVGGAPETTKRIKEDRAPVELVSLDSINQKYDAKLALEDADIATGKGITYRGVIISDGREIIKSAKSNKEKIDQDRRNDITEAKAENEKRKDKYNSETLSAGAWTMRFTGIGQVLMLICLFFSFGYRNAEDEELGLINTSSSPQNNSIKNPIKNPITGQPSQVVPVSTSTPASPHRKIGFKQYGLTDNSVLHNPQKDCASCATIHTAGSSKSVSSEKIQLVAKDIGKYKKYIRTIYPRTLEPIPHEEPDRSRKIHTINNRVEKLNNAIESLKELGINTSLNESAGKAFFS